MSTIVIAACASIIVVVWAVERRVRARRTERARNGWLGRRATREARRLDAGYEDADSSQNADALA